MQKALVFLVLFCISGATYGKDLFEYFQKGKLLPQHWCSCQIHKQCPVTFTPDYMERDDYIAHITVNPATNAIDCVPECKEPGKGYLPANLVENRETEPLGPSFMEMMEPEPSPTDEDRKNAAVSLLATACPSEPPIQRQELRLQKTYIQQNIETSRSYSMRFRIRQVASGKNDEKTSSRWVTAQWKEQSPIANGKKCWGASPFLAQRYDDGNLFVTVQDKDCRCIVASSKSLNGFKDGTPAFCTYIYPEKLAQKHCTPNLEVHYGSQGKLVSPAETWTTMTYRVQGGRNGNGNIEIYQNYKFIARITGMVGYGTTVGDASVKFKIGHYRDFISSTDTMDIDWIRVEAVGKHAAVLPRN